jgi:hypothetical protein
MHMLLQTYQAHCIYVWVRVAT